MTIRSTAAEPATTEARTSRRRITENSAWNLGLWVALTVLGFLTSPLMLHALGPAQFGILVLVNTAIAPLGLLDFGMSEATIKFVSEHIGRRDFPTADRLLRNTLTFNILAGVVGAAVLGGFSDFIAGRFFGLAGNEYLAASQCLKVIAVIWVGNMIRQSLVGVLTALRDYRTIAIYAFGCQAAFSFSGILAARWFDSVFAVVCAQAIAVIAGIIAGIFPIRRLAPQLTLLPAFNRDAFRTTFGFGRWQLVNNLSNLGIQQVLRWQIARSLPVAAVGVYNMAYQVGAVAYSIASRIGQVVFPEVSTLQGQGRTNEAASIVVTFNWIVGMVVVPAFATFQILAYDVMELWVGAPTASAAMSVLRVLCIGLSIASMFAIPSFYLLGIGRPRWLGVMGIAQAILTLGAASFLLPAYGLIGAAWALTAGTLCHIFVLAAMWRCFFRDSIRLRPYVMSVYAPPAIGILIGTVGSVLRDRWTIDLNGLATMGLAAVIYFAGVGALVGVARLSPDSREVLSAAARRFRGLKKRLTT